MIPGIEPLFQRIADGIAATVPDGWTSAEFHAMFQPDGSTYEAEFVRTDGTAVGFQPAFDCSRAVRELRQRFQQAGRLPWGQVWFLLRADGSFNVEWGYEGCDANGHLVFDEAAELARHEERRLRLIAGRPRRG